MIIFGWRSRARIVSSGSFICPRCGDKRWYSEISVRRWFTLFFIPLIPLDQLGSYIECRFCGSTYQQGVLKTPRPASAPRDSAEIAGRPRDDANPQLTQPFVSSTTEEAIRRLLVSISLADGKVTPDEAGFLIVVAQDFLPFPYSIDDLMEDIAAYSDDDVLATMRSMRHLSGTLSHQGRELLLQVAAFLAACDGEIHEAELRMLHDLARAFGLPRSQVGKSVEHAHSSLTEAEALDEPF